MEDLLQGDIRYEGVRHLGSGAQSSVLLARNKKTGEHVAIKFLPRGPDSVTKNVQREILTQSCLNHPYVLPLKEVFLTRTHLCIVLEYMAGGDLFKLCCERGPMPEQEARLFMEKIFVALDYCHQMGVVNRDVKPENILLNASKTDVKLGDFGFAKGKWDSLPHSRVGTPNYIAPEVLLAAHQDYDGKQADCWSCAVTLYTMLFHSYPFSRIEDPKWPESWKLITERTCRADYVLPNKPKVSEACKDFLRQCLQLDPKKRLTMEGIMKHPWMSPKFAVQAMMFNKDRLLCSLPSQSFMDQMKHIVEKARQPVGRLARRQPGFDLDEDLDKQILNAMQSL